jgi:hypothetical protein
MTKEQKQAQGKLYSAYRKGGQSAVYNLWNKSFSKLGTWKDCKPCEDKTPHIEGICQVCWTKN